MFVVFILSVKFSSISSLRFLRDKLQQLLLIGFSAFVCLWYIMSFNTSQDMNTRMAVGMTTILTIVFLLGSANASLPRVSYAKAIDWYLMVSFAFIFAAVLECMLVFHFRVDAKKGNKQKNPSKKVTEIRIIGFYLEREK